MSRNEDDLSCANNAANALKNMMNAKAEDVFDILAEHWDRVHERTIDTARKQALIIYIDGLSMHIKDLFYSMVVDEELFDPIMIQKCVDILLASPLAGMAEANNEMTLARSKMDETFKDLLRKHKSEVKH